MGVAHGGLAHADVQKKESQRIHRRLLFPFLWQWYVRAVKPQGAWLSRIAADIVQPAPMANRWWLRCGSASAASATTCSAHSILPVLHRAQAILALTARVLLLLGATMRPQIAELITIQVHCRDGLHA